MLMTQTPQPAPFSSQRHAYPSSDSSSSPPPGTSNNRSSSSSRAVAFPSAAAHAHYAGSSQAAAGAAYNHRNYSPTPNPYPGGAPPPQQQPAVMYVRALYDYEADDRTSLSFHEGDVIQVITQLESGWWDGVINGVRGWFPSNYCQVLSNPEDVQEDRHHDDDRDDDDDLDGDELYDDHYGPLDDGGEAERELAAHQQLPIEGFASGGGDKARADFWIPQATPDGRLFYYNTMTGESSMELPLESPSEANENGPRDRMNVAMPEKTRPPQEMMSQGAFMEEEEYESEGNSASEMDGESIMMASTGSLVCADTSYYVYVCINC